MYMQHIGKYAYVHATKQFWAYTDAGVCVRLRVRMAAHTHCMVASTSAFRSTSWPPCDDWWQTNEDADVAEDVQIPRNQIQYNIFTTNKSAH